MFKDPYARKLSRISEFKLAYEEYLELNSRHTSASEDQRKNELREQINMMISEVGNYIRQVGVPTHIYYSPPPAIGGLAGEVDLLANLFSLRNFRISPEKVVDILNRAIGNCLYLQEEYRIKRRNPLYWIGEAIRLPFRIMSFAGFDSKRIELSSMGKVYKLVMSSILSIAGVLSGLWALVQLLNYFHIKANWLH